MTNITQTKPVAMRINNPELKGSDSYVTNFASALGREKWRYK